MPDLLQKLPPILILGVLVGIFVSIRRYADSTRARLWLGAWCLIFLHFAVELAEPRPGTLGAALSALDLSFLAWGAVLFMGSCSSFLNRGAEQWQFIALLAIPDTVYIWALSFNVQERWLYIACLLALVATAGAFALIKRGATAYFVSMATASAAAFVWPVLKAFHGSYDEGIVVMLALGFGLPAVMTWKWNWRWSAGVVTVAGGFLAWGAVFPVGYLTDHLWPTLNIAPEIWNVPKMIVAVGMILTLLEDQTRLLQSSSERERSLNQQMHRFADLTTRLLSGVDANLLCEEIAAAITETTNFQRAAVILSRDDKSLYLAGMSAPQSSDRSALDQALPGLNTTTIADLCSNGERMGANSYLIGHQQPARYSCQISQVEYPDGSQWQTGDAVLVPMLSREGEFLGCIRLDLPRDPNGVDARETSKVEMLAGDLAITLKNRALQRQLVQSEKLAGLGQLVAGVAHELNNPLAGVLGYADLIGEETQDEKVRQRADRLLREAQRMKRIIDNLLRFARQNSLERRSANLETLLGDIIALREYHLRTRGVALETRIEPGLPPIALDEDQFKQILLNLLNNAVDAVESQPVKRIFIEASRSSEGKVRIRFEDNGPGFADLNRALDPFYTTKPVGQGTGLGLSICYGIVKEHGGEIQLTNSPRGGACVTVDFPASQIVAAV